MDLKQLLGKLDLIEGAMKDAEKHSTGPEFTGKWKGTDAGTPGKKMVGSTEESVKPGMMKDLAQVVKEKKTEWTLEEEYRAFLDKLEEENLGTHPKRPRRASDRPHREYGKTGEQSKRYKTIKTEAAADRVYTVDITRSRGMSPSTTRSKSGTLAELIEYFGYTLEVGKSYEGERGRYKINMQPKNIQSLVDNLNKAQSNAAANGNPSTYYDIGGEQLAEMDKSQTPPGRDAPYDYDKGDWHEGKPLKAKDVAGELSKSFGPSDYKWEITFRDGKRAVYHQSSPHYKDDTAASDIQYILKSNPGAKVTATKDGEPFDWESLLSEEFGGTPGGVASQPIGQQSDTDISKMSPQQKQELLKQLDPNAAKKTAAASTQLKSATGSQVPATNLVTALDKASKGQAVDPKTMTALKPVMDVVKKAATDPKLATQFKSLASAAKASG